MPLSHLRVPKTLRAAVAFLALASLSLSSLLAPAPAMGVTASSVGAAIPAAALDTPELIISDNVTSFVLDSNMLLWSKYDTTNCVAGGELPYNCAIRSKPAAGGAARTLFYNSNLLDAGWDVYGKIAVDNSYVYWPHFNRVARLPRNASNSSTSQTVAVGQLITATVQEVVVDGAYLFWTENYRSLTPGENRGFIFRQPKSGGVAEMMGQYFAVVSRLKADGSGGVYFIDATFNNVLGHVFPSGGGFGSQYVVGSNIQGYTLDANNLYWADASAGVRIRSAPRSDMAAGPTNLHILDAVGSPVVTEMAVDGENLYWQEKRLLSGPIYRLSLGGGAPQAITGNLQTLGGLVSDGRSLYFSELYTIYRLATAAAPVQLDLLADGPNMEIVQTIQSPANDVPLVAGKETFVRVHGQIVLSSAGLAQLNIFPAVRLNGTRDGAPLPGSPLTPISNNSIRSAATDRTLLDNGFLFRLPANWTQGTVELRAEINPSRVAAETTYTNNSVTKTAVFVRKLRVCLDMIPVATTSGTISAWNPGRERHMVRGAALMPVPAFLQLWRGGPPHLRPNMPLVVDRLNLFGSGPYSLDNDADMGYLLFNMTFDYIVRALVTDCFAVAMVPNAARFGMSAGEVSPVFMFLESFGGDARIAPDGGTKGLAHELSHSLGRAHVLCPTSGTGAPAGPDPGYPYPSCQLDTVGTNQHIGFDPLTRRLILPLDGGDLMSYASLTWTSDYTYRALFNRIPTVTAAGAEVLVPAPAVGQVAASPAANPQLLVSGLISATAAGEIGIVNFTYAVGPTEQAGVAAKIAATTAVEPAYELRVLDAAGSVLAAAPLNVAVTEAEGGTPMKLFFTLIDPNPAAVRLEVVKVGQGAIGSRTAGAAAPAITITSPTAGVSITESLTIAWNAADPDGDALMFSLRYSPDNGATWLPLGAPVSENRLVVDMNNGLPGGSQALVQVVASDGVHSTAATAGPFSLQRHAPHANILGDEYAGLSANGGAGANQHETVVLHGRGYDAEDGQLDGPALQWNVMGPVARSGDGEHLTLAGLPPGVYTVQLAVTDSDNQAGQAAVQFTVAPKRIFDGSEPALDGLCTDDAYAADTDPVTLRYADGSVAEARFVHAGGAVYACFAGLPVGTATDSFAGLRFDLDNSGGPIPMPEDLGFFVGRDGVPVTVRGDGAGEFLLDELPNGLQAAVSQSEDGVYWNAELRIDEGRLGGWNKLLRMRVTHYWRNFVGDDTGWPLESGYNVPGTWGLTALGQLSQLIDFAPLSDRTLGDPPFALAATASSGLPVAYTSLTPAVCTVADGVVTLIAAGMCTIEAGQSGSAAYSAAPGLQRSFNVRAPQPPPQRSLYLPFARR